MSPSPKQLLLARRPAGSLETSPSPVLPLHLRGPLLHPSWAGVPGSHSGSPSLREGAQHRNLGGGGVGWLWPWWRDRVADWTFRGSLGGSSVKEALEQDFRSLLLWFLPRRRQGHLLGHPSPGVNCRGEQQ